jgi:HEAT repeat protein
MNDKKHPPRPTKSRPAEAPSELQPEASKVKKRVPAVYIEPRYPTWLMMASLVWTLVGWFLASQAPNLAFLPFMGVLHYVFPAITVGLIGVNAYGALRNLWNGVHPLRLLMVTGLQIGLFTTLFYQLFAHGGAEFFEADHATQGRHFLVFSLAHGFRAADLFDVVEAFDLNIQSVKQRSIMAAVFVIAYHAIIDTFILAVLWQVIERIKRRLMKDDGIRSLVTKSLIWTFAVWLLVLIVFVSVQRWRPLDIPLWLLENVLRVVDFVDVMQSFDIRLHTLPREGLTGLLTFLCCIWIGIGIGFLVGKKKKRPAMRPVATPPDVNAFAFWSRQVGMVCGVLVAILVVGLVGQALAGRPAPRLAAAVADASVDRAAQALSALRRMGPTAAEVIPTLVSTRPQTSPAVQQQITHTLGYLGPNTVTPLTEIALADDETGALTAVASLGRVGPEGAEGLARVWRDTPHAEVKRQSEAELRDLGTDAVPILMAATTLENADTNYHWFGELHPNWRLVSSSNEVVRELRHLPDYLQQLEKELDADRATTILRGVRGCGSAAQLATPRVIELLKYKDNTVRAEAKATLVAIGPSATPELLRELGAVRDVSNHPILGILSERKMWNTAVARDESAVKVLMVLLVRSRDNPQLPQLQGTALHALSLAGDQAQPALPLIVALLGDLNEEKRKEVRAALTRIDDTWLKNPAINQAIPDLLPWLTALPPDESKELFEALGDLPGSEGERLVQALTTVPGWSWQKQEQRRNELLQNPSSNRGEVNKQVAAEEKRDREAYRERMFVALERLGPRVKAATPALAKLLEDFPPAGAPDVYFARQRLVKSLKHILPDLTPVVPGVLAVLGTSAEGHTFLKEHKPAALRYLSARFEDKDVSRRLSALPLVGLFGAEAKPLLPKVIECLREQKWLRIDNKERPSREVVLAVLAKIDKDWAKDPTALPVLGEVMDSGQRIDQLLGELGPVAQPLVPKLIRLMLDVEKTTGKAGFDNDALQALEKIDPRWREHPAGKAVASELLKRLARKEYGDYIDRNLTQLSFHAAAELGRMLPGAPDDVKLRIYGILREAGPASKAALPDLVQQLARADEKWTYLGVEVLGKIDPHWGDHAAVKQMTATLIAAQMERPNPGEGFVKVCAALGTGTVPELVKRVEGDKVPLRKLAMTGLRGVGPAAQDALPTVVKAAQDKDIYIRQEAVRTLGKIGVGHKELVRDLTPLLASDLNTDVLAALGAVDSDWRQSPLLKPGLAVILKQLSHQDHLQRRLALVALEQLGPAEGVLPAVERMAAREMDPVVMRFAETTLSSLRNKKK